MSIPLLGILIFSTVLLLIELLLYSYRIIVHPDRSEIRKRLMQSAMEDEKTSHDILKRQVLSDVPFVNRLLPRIPGIARIQLAIEQANVKYTLGFFILLSIFIGISGFAISSMLMINTVMSIAIATVVSSLPYLLLITKKKKRMAKFERQLPDALGLIARALRAGHAFTSGMKLAADEFDDPIGPYFGQTLDQINFGVNVTNALKNLAIRVDSPDIRFFVVSVILQRETGGNLAEIIEGLAHLIRERFRFRGKVRTLTAEARMAGIILTVTPMLLFFIILFLNPKYGGILIHDPVGRILLLVAACLMFLAHLVIKRIVRLDV